MSTVDQFVKMITPRPSRTGRVTENDDYAAMVLRILRGLEYRAIEDPALLPLVVAIEKRAREIANVTIATNATRFAVNPHAAASMAECARTLKISVPSASERRKIGDRIIGERVTAAGAARFSEARRERDMIEAAEAEAVISMAEYRARHRAA